MQDETAQKLVDGTSIEGDCALIELLASEALHVSSLTEAMKKLSRSLCTSIGVDRVSVAVRDSEQDELVFAEVFVAALESHTTPFLASGVAPMTVFKFAELGKPLLADDVYQHPILIPFADQIFRPVGIRALMQIPIEVNCRMVGVFNVSVCNREWSWTASHLRFGNAIASLAALVIERHGRRFVVAQQSAAAERLERKQVALSRLMLENTRNGLGLEQELRALTEAAAAALEVERVSIWRFSSDKQAIAALDIHDARDRSHAAGITLSRQDHPAYFDALLAEGMLVVNDIRNDARTQSFVAGYVPVTGVTALLDMGIVANLQTIGVVCVESCRSQVIWSEEQKLFVASVTSLAALAIERHERQRAEAGVRETSRRLSSHFTAINTVIQSDVFHRGGFEEAMRHLSRALCHEIRAERVAIGIAAGDGLPEYAESYAADVDLFCALDDTRQIQDALDNEVTSERLVDGPGGFCLSVPIRFHGKVVGSVRAWTKLRDHAWSSGEMLMASIVAHLSILVLERQNRLKIERNLRHANKAAEEANRAKTQFLANMSHEIRTPMNGVFGMTDLLLRTPLTDRQTQIVGTIQQSTSALLTIINDILDISRIESGRVELDAKPFQLKTCIDGAAALFVEEARRKSIELAVVIAPECPEWVLGDAARLRQVCVNLIGNAIKFTLSGKVSVQIQGAAGAAGVARLMFKVTDTGIGIERSVVQRLFKPFAQADGSITRRFGGTGLGLSISRSLIELMGGSISLESEPGVGTVVDFDIRVSAVHSAIGHTDAASTLSAWLSASPTPSSTLSTTPTVIAPAGVKPQRRFGGRVLVAEDNIVNQEVTRELVGELGCAVTCVENGQEAIRAFETGAYDLVLMDCQMPVMDGLSATRAIRAIERNRQSARIPIVAVTANAFAEDREACLDAGMDSYLSKPFNSQQLDSILLRWLPAHLVAERRGAATRTNVVLDGNRPDIDPVVLEPMKRLRVEFYRRLLKTYLQYTPQLVEALVVAAQSGDLVVLRTSAHSLKSSSANVGAVRLSELARDIEAAVVRNETAHVGDSVAELVKAFGRVRALFEAELAVTERPGVAVAG